MRRRVLRRDERRFHVGNVLSRHPQRAGATRHPHGTRQERDVRPGDNGGGLPGRLLYGAWLGRSWPLDDCCGGEIDLSRRRGRPGLHLSLLLHGLAIAMFRNGKKRAEAPADSSGPSIVVRNLHVNYGDREILHGISFEVQAGETMVILGGSGSGKSTLLRTLVGLEQPVSGEIWIGGKNFPAMSEEERDELRKKMGMSFQGGALFGSMTVGENVALPLREHTDLEDSTIEIIVRLKLEQVGLEGFEYYAPSQLSGGMKKRAAVARALAMDPEILLFDEPSAGLDPIIAAGIDQLIIQLKHAFRMTIIVVTHELASAFLIADRMLLIDKGNVITLGTREEMLASTQPRVRQFLDRIAEPEISGELDYLQMLTADLPRAQRVAGKRG